MKRALINIYFFSIGLVISGLLFFVPYAHAQTPATVAAIEHLIDKGSYSAAAASAAATEAIKTAAGKTIPVTSTATAAVTAARIGGVAAKALKVGNVVGLASIVLPWVWNQSGYTVCPAPDFICKPGLPVDIRGGYQSEYGAACAYASQLCTPVQASSAYCTGAGYPSGPVAFNTTPNPVEGATQYTYYFSCGAGGSLKTVTKQKVTSCPSGYSLSAGQCVIAGSPVSAPESEVASSLATAIGTDMQGVTSRGGKVFTELQKDPASKTQIFLPTDTVTINAPAVSAPPVVTTSQQANPDGTTSTKVLTEVTTVTPVVTGTKIQDTKITYPAVTMLTTTLTNNSTNVMESFNSTVAETGAVDDSPQMPTDYNKESTQAKVASDLDLMRRDCELFPKKIGCSELDAAPVAPEIEKTFVPVSYVPVVFASSATCPAPITFDMYGPRFVSFEPMCDVMALLRPLFLACGAAACAFIFMGSLKI